MKLRRSGSAVILASVLVAGLAWAPCAAADEHGINGRWDWPITGWATAPRRRAHWIVPPKQPTILKLPDSNSNGHCKLRCTLSVR